jgi:hypothetical protein
MVVLPDIDTTWSLGRSDAPLHLHCGPDGRVIWGLDLPQKEICMCDSVLRQAWESDAAEQYYEDLCLSYVAMTRARQGLYLLSRRLSAASRCRDLNRLLHETFSSNGKVLGNPAWHQEKQRRASAIEDPPVTPLACEPQGDPRPILPSRASAAAVNAASLLGKASVLTAGSDVHRALARIAWIEDGLPDFGDLPESAQQLIHDFLKTRTAMRLFKKPATPQFLWRERAFDVMIDGQWISGAFDRVVVHLGNGGEPLRAAIYDFKTSEGEIAGTYGEQMNLYRRCLGRLIGLAEDKITSSLIAVRTGEEIPVGHPLIQAVFLFD